MHQALPPRKFSTASQYHRNHWSTSLRRRRLKYGAILSCLVVMIMFLCTRIPAPSSDRVTIAPDEVVIVTLIEPDMQRGYIAQVKENRDYYAAKHGYQTFFPNATDYHVGSAPKSWALIPALRHAMTLYPKTPYFFALSAHSVILNTDLSMSSHVMAPERLETLMLKDKPVVPPDSVIHTFSHLKGDKIDLVLTQDGEGLCQESFVLRQGEWAKFFLDIWFDPLYRSYNFQKAEGHALEHVVQWHPTILTKLALIPQRTINAYTIDIGSRGGKKVTYHEGDLLARAVGCEREVGRDCEKEMQPWYAKFKKIHEGEFKR